MRLGALLPWVSLAASASGRVNGALYLYCVTSLLLKGTSVRWEELRGGVGLLYSSSFPFPATLGSPLFVALQTPLLL